MTGSKKKPVARVREPALLGWREWISLPKLRIETIKAKVDTGARTSSLHAFDIEEFTRGKKEFVRFAIHPEQRNSRHTVKAEAPVCDWREVRSSSGQVELRPVILTTLEVFGIQWEAELTLTRRDEMGFRMLLGRQAIRGHFHVDPGTSFLNGKRAKGTRRLRKLE